ncbi:MAG: DinB family protein [Acidobacteriota bacterium]|nr:DinB family protein [Acidobacteriota bacterium]
MNADLEQTLALLECGPATFNALLRTLPDAWTLATESDASWSPRYVVGHLVYCEHGNWLERMEWILEHGESKPFEPLNREGGRERLKTTPLPALLDEFAEVRANKLAKLRAINLQPADLERKGKHPAFRTVTLGQLLATWAAHDMTHLHQVSRILAKQYDEAVGPWKQYLGVLHCDGHSVKD